MFKVNDWRITHISCSVRGMEVTTRKLIKNNTHLPRPQGAYMIVFGLRKQVERSGKKALPIVFLSSYILLFFIKYTYHWGAFLTNSEKDKKWIILLLSSHGCSVLQQQQQQKMEWSHGICYIVFIRVNLLIKAEERTMKHLASNSKRKGGLELKYQYQQNDRVSDKHCFKSVLGI